MKKPCSGCGEMREHVEIGGITIVGCETCVWRAAMRSGERVARSMRIGISLHAWATANHDPGDEDARR